MVSLCLVEKPVPAAADCAPLSGYGPATAHIADMDRVIFEQLLCLGNPTEAPTSSKASPRIRLVKPSN